MVPEIDNIPNVCVIIIDTNSDHEDWPKILVKLNVFH